MTFLMILIAVGLFFAVIQGLLGIPPSDELEHEDSSHPLLFTNDNYDEEVLDELIGVENHGHGFYGPIKSNTK